MAHAPSPTLLGLAVFGLVAGPAVAKPTPAAKCLSAKMKAVAKKTVAKVACEVKAAQKLKPVDRACLAKAGAGFVKAFGKAETQAKGGCLTTGDATDLEASVDAFVQSLVSALPDGGSKDGGKCAATKRKASAAHVSQELLCQAKAATKAIPVDPECIGKSEGAFMKAFDKAEQKGGCATTGDLADLDAAIDDFVDQVVARLSGMTTTTVTTTTTASTGGPTTSNTVPATTTTSSPATTSTSSPGATTTSTPGATTTSTPGATTTSTPVATTTSTTQGNTMVTVVVGPNNDLRFDPPTVTIRVGDTVRWSWATSFHSVVSGQVVAGQNAPDGKFCSPSNTACDTMQLSMEGATYDHTFTVAGTYPYFCAPHGVLGMVGSVIVQP